MLKRLKVYHQPIAIDQKTTSHNPRSTVGTVTEIYDYLRLLWARIGIPFCPVHNEPIQPQTTKEIVDKIFELKDNTKINILSPVAREKKGTHADLLKSLKLKGFVRVKIDGEIKLLENEIILEKNKRHTISIVVDRMSLDKEKRSRINQAVEACALYSDGLVLVENMDEKTEVLYSKNYSCKHGDFSLPELEPRLFSFNAPMGYCPKCKGLGAYKRVDWNLLAKDKTLTINQGGIEYYKNTVGTQNIEWQKFDILLKHYNINKDKPVSELTDEEIDLIMYGSKEPIQYTLESKNENIYQRNDFVEGVAALIERRYIETSSEFNREYYMKFMAEHNCDVCKGKRLNKYALSVKVGDLNIYDFSELPIEDALKFIKNIKLSKEQKQISELVLNEIQSRLEFMSDVGLEYLNLNRTSNTLSGGESQRIRLATQIGSNLSGVIYVLDEPSIGLHQRDNDRLIATLKKMRDLGNTVIVVEHDEDMIRNADHILDIGPEAGEHGGKVVAEGTFKEIVGNYNSLTSKYMRGDLKIDVPSKRRSGKGKIVSFGS